MLASNASAENSQANEQKEPDTEMDWSFANLKPSQTLWGPHGYHRYPAKFIPQLVRCLIEGYSTAHSLVGDPFLGSATTGIEALRTGRAFWGADINPVALLISRAKCHPVDSEEIKRCWRRLDQRLECLPQIGRRALTTAETSAIQAIDISRASAEERLAYWFPTTYRATLEQLLHVITRLRNAAHRTFFLCAFSNILRGCSIWLSGSTKPQKDLAKILSGPLDSFRRQVRDMLRRNDLYWTDLTGSHLNPSDVSSLCALELQDARRLPLSDGHLDLIVTSPPYATCYQYLELHQLTQLWFERHHLIESSDLRHACIGGKGISAREGDGACLSTRSKAADHALAQLAAPRQGSVASTVDREVRALRYYFQDMRAAISEMARVTARGKYLVLIIGDSTKRGINIPTSAALSEMALASGFELQRKIVRQVPARVLVSTRDKKTGRFSSAAQSDTRVYPEEDILIFKRGPRSH
ncbi:MAG TPA: DNA methyltransferase [Blastocatellia bacterium]|nr:DNA methyltransferase [Blastocatellia bacterium]